MQDAVDVPYDNTASGLESLDVQAAVDELAACAEGKHEHANKDLLDAYTIDVVNKINGIEDGATADQTKAEIKIAYECNSDTNAFTNAEKAKLATIETYADVTDYENVNTAGAVMNTDCTTVEMKFVLDEDDMASDSDIAIPTQQSVKAYVAAERRVDSVNGETGVVVLDADHLDDTSTAHKFLSAAQVAKLDGIEDGADVTDAASVEAAGALMDSELATVSGIKTLNVPANTAISSYGKTIVESLTASQARSVLALVIGTNVQAYSAVLQATTASFTTADQTKLDGIEELADVTDATNVAAAGAVMETDTSTAAMAFVLDEDDLVSDSATAVPTQQSVKAYIDALKARVTALENP